MPDPEAQTRLREIGRNSGRTALLWATALTIVWLSGLEATRSDLAPVFGALQANHSALQRLDRRLVAGPSPLEVDWQQRQLAALKSHKGKSARPGREADLEREIKALERSLASVPARQQRLSDLQKDLEKERAARKVVLQDLRQKRRQVAFDILGQRFDVPPFYAPIVWNAFLVSLLLYLLVRRNTILALSTQALAAADSSLPADVARRSLLTDLPWWIAPLPADLSTQASLAWHLANLAVVAGLGLIGLAQIRVCWVGLELSRWLATGRERAVLTLILSALLSATIAIACRWLRPQGTLSGRLAWVPWVGALIVAVLAITASFGSSGRLGYRFAQGFEDSLPILAIVWGLIAAIIALVTWRSYGVVHGEVARGPTRRWVVAALGVSALGLFGTRLVRRKLPLHRPLRPRYVRPKPPLQSRLPSGFYWNPRSGVIHRINSNGRGACDRSITREKVERLDLASDQVDDLLTRAVHDWQPKPGVDSGTPEVRVHEACARSFFEEAALAPLRGKRIKEADIEVSLSRLVMAVRYEAMYSFWHPNYRLFDLLAALATRNDRYDRFQELREAIAYGNARAASSEQEQTTGVSDGVLRLQLQHHDDEWEVNLLPRVREPEPPLSEWSLHFQRREEQWNRVASTWNRRIESRKPLHWGYYLNGPGLLMQDIPSRDNVGPSPTQPT